MNSSPEVSRGCFSLLFVTFAFFYNFKAILEARYFVYKVFSEYWRGRARESLVDVHGIVTNINYTEYCK